MLLVKINIYFQFRLHFLTIITYEELISFPHALGLVVNIMIFQQHLVEDDVSVCQ